MNRKIVMGVLAVAAVVAGVWLMVSRSRGDVALRQPHDRVVAAAAKPAPTAPPATGGPAPRSAAVHWSLDADPEGPLRLEGQVIDPDGHGVGGAEVWLSAVPARTAKTEDDGTFAFDKLVGRSYTISAARGELLGGPVRFKLTAHSDPVVIRIAAAAGIAVSVVDQAGHPIKEAEVKLGDSEEQGPRPVKTGDGGTARLAPVRPGWLTIVASAPGFAPGSAFATAGAAGTTALVTVRLRRGYPVSGRVRDEAGKPIGGARITIDDGPWGGQIDTGSATSDAQGGFTIAALAAGAHALVAVDGEHAPARSPQIAVSDRPVGNVEIVMKAGGVVAGKVFNPSHQPVPFAAVRVAATGPRIQAAARQTTTDQNGGFEVRGLPRVKLQARAESDAAASAIADADLSDRSERRDLELVLDVAGTIAGTVVDDKGAPVPEVAVNAFPDILRGASTEGLAVAGLSSTVTGGDGGFTIHGLPDGSYRLWAARGASGRGVWGQQSTAARTGDQGVRIVLSAPGTLIGQLALFGSGAAPAVASVSIGQQSASPVIGGRFRVEDIEPGSYDVAFRGLEFPELVRGDVKIEPGKVTDLGTVTVPRGRRVTGVVVDAAGAPVAGAQVKLGAILMAVADDSADQTNIDEVSGVRSAIADGRGAFAITGVPTTPTSVMAEHPARGRSVAVAVPEGEVDPPAFSLVVRGFGSIAGKVTRKGQPVADATITESSPGGATQGQVARTGADGTFVMSKVSEGSHVLNAMQQTVMSVKSTSLTVNVIAGQQATANIEVPIGEVTVAVQIKPRPGDKVDAAQVFLFAGTVNLATGRQLIDGVLQSSLQGTKFWLGADKPTPEFAELVAGDYSICALPITGELSDPQFQRRLQSNLALLKVYCKPAHVAAAPLAQSFAIDVPAMSPLPAPAQ